MAFLARKPPLSKWADQNGVKVVRWFEERGVSGTVLERPALSDMMVALMSNGVHLVVVEKLDRIARDQMVQESIIQSLIKNGFELVSAASGEENLCGSDPGRKLMRTIMGAIAEYDKQMLVLKLRAAKQRKKANPGWSEGRKPFGFREGEPEIVARMMSLRAEGHNWEDISNRLNVEGLKTRSKGIGFPQQFVASSLHNKRQKIAPKERF